MPSSVGGTHMPQFPQRPFPAERVLVGMSGSIAAVLVPPGLMWMKEVLGVRELRVVMTPQAATLIPPATISAIVGDDTAVDWQQCDGRQVAGSSLPHLALAAWPELIVVMPATANLLAKLAFGFADNLLTTCLLAAECPIVLAPGMNRTMWDKPATQRNVAQLEADGFRIVRPHFGLAVSTRLVTYGAMADVATVMAESAAQLGATPLGQLR
jgi:phosphopantothenoylcysteine synthetase/decarboxylase